MAKKGRPPASPNREYDTVEASPTVCKRCGSTDRASYDAKIERISFQNTHVNPKTGRQFNVIEYRPTRCLNCNQHRKDKTEVLEERDT